VNLQTLSILTFLKSSFCKLFDCDFNQQLGYGIGAVTAHEGGISVFDIDSLMDLQKYVLRQPLFRVHCWNGIKLSGNHSQVEVHPWNNGIDNAQEGTLGGMTRLVTMETQPADEKSTQ
jgi:hypothetical protein